MTCDVIDVADDDQRRWKWRTFVILLDDVVTLEVPVYVSLTLNFGECVTERRRNIILKDSEACY